MGKSATPLKGLKVRKCTCELLLRGNFKVKCSIKIVIQYLIKVQPCIIFSTYDKLLKARSQTCVKRIGSFATPMGISLQNKHTERMFLKNIYNAIMAFSDKNAILVFAF